MLGGMRALPDDAWSASGDGSGVAPLPGKWIPHGMVRHTFTHFTLELSVQRFIGDRYPPGAGEWWPIDLLEDAGLPTLFAKAARLVPE